jgi:hypothetical protein
MGAISIFFQNQPPFSNRTACAIDVFITKKYPNNLEVFIHEYQNL